MEKHNSKKSLKTLFGVLSDCLDKMSAIRLTNYLNILLGVHSAKSNFQESFVDKIIFEVTQLEKSFTIFQDVESYQSSFSTALSLDEYLVA
jgi:hypothetical protein